MKTSTLILIIVIITAGAALVILSRPNLISQPTPETTPTPTQTVMPSPTQTAPTSPTQPAPTSPTPDITLGPSPTPHPNITLETPQFGKTISSPLTVTGEARGTWYFEGSFPVVLTNWDGEIIAEAQASAQGEWMTEDFVPFEAELEFETPELYNRGSLILQKSNPSGKPELDDAYEITVLFR